LSIPELPKYHLLPRQAEFIHSPAKYTAYVAGLGSGKTFAGCVKALKKSKPGQPGMIVAPTFPMLRDVTQKKFFELLDIGNYPYTFNKAENSAQVFGTQVLFRSADEPERLRGVNLNWAYLDEAALMKEDVWRIILGRLRTGPDPEAWITTTPAGYNWVWRYWVEKANDNYALFHSATRENVHLPPDYLRDLEANYSGEFAKQEIEGEFVAFEGLVYLEFSRNIHVYKDMPLPVSWWKVRSIDFGYTNPFVCLWGAVDADGRLYVYDEHYRSRTLIRDHADVIKRRGEGFQWSVSDHDAQDVAELNACGIHTRNAQKDVILGIQRLKNRLKVQGDGWPRLMVSEKCVNTIKEFGAYRWQESKESRNDKEEPQKESDHAMDALRYMVMELDNVRGRMTQLAGVLGL
jgi:phage terminase large subunit